MEKLFDPENMNRIKSSDRKKLFVPIEEVPDPNPDPSEVLMMKEELLGQPSKTHDMAPEDVNDLGRVPTYLAKEFKEEESDRLLIPKIPSETEKIADEIEGEILKEKKTNHTLISQFESHGRRGKKPINKDKIKPLSEEGGRLN